MIYLAHALPFACKSNVALGYIFDPSKYQSFHQKWPLNGWHDDIIQPAQDAVLEYYKVGVYGTLFCAKLIQRNSILSAMQRAVMLITIC